MRAPAALLCLTASLVSARAGADARVAFANCADDGEAGRAAIERLRAGVRRAGGVVEVGGELPAVLAEPPGAPAAAAAAELARARARLAEADEAYTRFAWDDALARLGEAAEILLALPPGPEVAQALADLRLQEGLVLADRGDRAGAIEAFRAVRRLAPERAGLDAALHRRAVVALYAKAGKPVPARQRGRLSVVTRPGGATVTLDGQDAGAAPRELADLAPGPYVVSARLDGHARRSERVRVAAGVSVRVELDLAPLGPAERARALRADLARLDAGDEDRRRAAAALAELAAADLLILVRTRAGAAEAAVYDRERGALGAWAPATVESLAAALPAAPPTPGDAAAGHEGGRRPGADLTDPPYPPRRRPPWYRTWWGLGAIGGVVLAAAAITAVALTAEDHYSIQTWCHAPCPPP